jgi:hypothetical protein
VKVTVVCFGTSFKSAIRRKRSGLLSYVACLQHDSVRLHAAIHTVKQIQDLKLEALFRPPCAPGLSPIDFHLIWPLKDVVSDRVSSDEVKDIVHDCLAYRPKDFFCFRGIYALMKRRRRRVEVVRSSLKISAIVLCIFLQ